MSAPQAPEQFQTEIKRRPYRKLQRDVDPGASALLDGIPHRAKILRYLAHLDTKKQMQCVRLMISANSFATIFCRMVVYASPRGDLATGYKKESSRGLSRAQILRMEKQYAQIIERYWTVEPTYAVNNRDFVLARGYLARLLNNAPVVRFLEERDQPALVQFEALVKFSPVTK